MNPSWTLLRRLSTLLSVAGVLLLLLVAGAAVGLAAVHRQQELVTDRYFTIVNSSDASFLDLVNAETAVRGYLLTGQKAIPDVLTDLDNAWNS